ncbi:formate dehydrogenase subunit delta [Parasphingorhabdus sp.]|uniref:formate dehydrogenase subunit delta n=1 Tax=Parasphingorhabdus sp. TaxID=2709688 RepID=UPI003265BCF2
MNTLDHLVHMLDQITRNFGTLDDGAAAEATAEHILLYWDPRMKNRIITYGASDESDLSEVAAQAITIVAQKVPASATIGEA